MLITALSGNTLIESSVGATPLTSNSALPVTVPNAALIMTLPSLTPKTSPVAETVAIEVSLEDQVTKLLMSKVLPSEYSPVAIKL